MHVDSWGVAIGAPVATLLLAHTAMGSREAAGDLIRLVMPDAALGTLSGARYLQACGYYHLATGRGMAALGDFERCGSLLQQLGIDAPAVIPWRSDLALAHLRLGRRKTARDLVSQQMERPIELTGARVRGISFRVLAAASELHQRPALLREGIDLLQAAGDRLELARALADLSFVHHELGEFHLARAVRSRAAEDAKYCRAGALSAWLARHGSPVQLPRPVESPEHLPVLSDAERRVAELAAFGHTNRDISRKLFITVSTVEQHLTHVYRKLKVNGRQDLPASLARHRVTAGNGDGNPAQLGGRGLVESQPA